MRGVFTDRPWLVAAFLALGGVARSEPPPATGARPEPEVKWDHPDPAHTPERAGYPGCIRRGAVPTNGPDYRGGFIGGGAPCGKGDGPCVGDGTWGWDYTGCLPCPERVFLRWFHCRPRQPPGGPYATDGRPVPDVFSVRPLLRLRETRKDGEEGCQPER
jgi:hypothetical protein